MKSNILYATIKFFYLYFLEQFSAYILSFIIFNIGILKLRYYESRVVVLLFDDNIGTFLLSRL